MSDITVAVDEAALNQIFDSVLTSTPPWSAAGNSALGPFFVNYSISASLASGDVDLVAPQTIRMDNVRLNWNVFFSFGIDLSDILPDFCLPRVCVDIPCVGTVCTPKICVDWPTISIPVSYGDFLKLTADLGISISLAGGTWRVEGVVQGIPNLQFGAATAGLLAAISAAATPLLLAVPFIGPFLAIAVNAIVLTIGVAGVLGFLGAILSPFVAGIRIPIYSQPQLFQILAADGPNDPAVQITLDAVSTVITSDNEDELVLEIDIS